MQILTLDRNFLDVYGLVPNVESIVIHFNDDNFLSRLDDVSRAITTIDNIIDRGWVSGGAPIYTINNSFGGHAVIDGMPITMSDCSVEVIKSVVYIVFRVLAKGCGGFPCRVNISSKCV